MTRLKNKEGLRDRPQVLRRRAEKYSTHLKEKSLEEIKGSRHQEEWEM